MNSIRLTLLPLLLLTCFIPGCSQQTTDDTINPNLYWETSDPQSEGIDPQVLESIHQDIEDGQYGLIDHFLLIRNNKVIYDKAYYQDYEAISKNYDTTKHQYNYDHPDWHPFYNRTKLHSLQSVSKSITSLLLGIAMDEGRMIPLDSAIFPLFHEYEYEIDFSDERKRSITLEDLLTMRSGIKWDESSSYADNPENSCIIMELTDDWTKYVLSRPMDTLPGTEFVYNSGATVLLGEILRKTTGQRIDQWAEEKLFGPLGITDYYWKETPKGEIDTEGGLYLSAYDLAKIGHLMLNGGVWENQQIVSQSWIEESVKPYVKFNEQSGYGFQWWVPSFKNGQTEIFSCRGYGGQFLIVHPDENIIVVFNGWNIHGGAEKSSYTVLSQRILPTLGN